MLSERLRNAELAYLKRPTKLKGAAASLLSAPAPPPRCTTVADEFGGRPGVHVAIGAPVDCTERYSTVVHCGGATLLLRRTEARSGPTIHHDYWWTVLRVARGDGGFGGASVSVPSALNLSHNAAFACASDGRSVVAYGGRRKTLAFRDLNIRERGIHVSVGRIRREAGRPVDIVWSRPRLVHSGARETGCVERRSRVGPDCEFDGKLSLVRWRGRTLLYARANIAEYGGRHVQMTWRDGDDATDATAGGGGGALGGGWSRWQSLRFVGGVTLGATSSNIYYFAVRTLRGDSDGAAEGLVAFFPAVLGEEGGLFASTSDDGLLWRAPRRLLPSPVLPEWRTPDYPVDGYGLLPPVSIAPVTQLLVEHDVVMEHGRALAGCVRPATLCAYNLTLPSSLLQLQPPTHRIEHPRGLGGRAGRSVGGSRGRAGGAGGVCAAGDAKIAVVMRGEAFRWGCSEAALDRQLAAVKSHVTLAQTLEAKHASNAAGVGGGGESNSRGGSGSGACARFFVAVDDRANCGPAAIARLLSAFGPRLAASSTFDKAPADQGAAARAALEVFKEHTEAAAEAAAGGGGSGSSSGVGSFALLFVSRLDLTLLTPSLAPWGCGGAPRHLRVPI